MTKISTDTNPDPAFYQTSVADALAAHKPFVLVFATPKFCQTKTCGPTLDKVKAVAAKHPDVTFINVEPYLLEDVDGQLQPVLDAKGNLQPGRRRRPPTACCPSRSCSSSAATARSRRRSS